MSTRAQLQVTDGDDKVTLYHHCDGYPDNMVHSVFDAHWNKHAAIGPLSYKNYRTGYVAGMLCKVDSEFQPLDYHDLHGDIEFYYILDVSKDEWEISVYAVNESKSGKMNKKRLFKGKISDAYLMWNRVNMVKRVKEMQAKREKASK